jgi:hypothetical protein
MLKFFVENQKIHKPEWYTIADKQIEFVDCEFEFSKEWDGLDKTAQFSQDCKTYNVHLGTENKSCYLPTEIHDGIMQLSIFGYSTAENSSLRATTAGVNIRVQKSGFVSSEETPIPPTPDLYAQLIAEIEEKTADIQNGKDGKDGVDGKDGIDGKDGKDGYSPTISVENSENGYRLTINDINLTQTVEINNGADGADGTDGTNGKDGQDGTNGVDGVSPTVDIVTTENGYTLTITDINGTKTATISNGTDGKDGINGTDGTNGVDGKDGLSAYEIAVNSGFSGTESEWIESLKGQDGKDGENGKDGKDGVDGKDGEDGTSIKILGSGDDVSSLPTSGNTNGDCYIIGGDLYVFTGTGEVNGFTNTGKIKGENGENGTDGVSPTATVTATENGYTITITDVNGTTTAQLTNGVDGKDGTNGKDGADGTNGKDGTDGISPTVSSEEITNGTMLIITDSEGEHKYPVLNGTGVQLKVDTKQRTLLVQKIAADGTALDMYTTLFNFDDMLGDYATIAYVDEKIGDIETILASLVEV